MLAILMGDDDDCGYSSVGNCNLGDGCTYDAITGTLMMLVGSTTIAV